MENYLSKPLGYYVDISVEPFSQLEDDFGIHLERLPREIKLVLRACLSQFLTILELERGYNLQEVTRDCFHMIPRSAKELADWESFFEPFWGEDSTTIESFLTAISEQLRLDY